MVCFAPEMAWGGVPMRNDLGYSSCALGVQITGLVLWCSEQNAIIFSILLGCG